MARIPLMISSVMVIALISGLIVVLPMALPVAHAQSTAMVSETVGSGSPSGAPGYDPDVIDVVVGVNNTITWTNNDLGHNHTVTSMEIPPGAKPFDSGKMAENATFTVTLTVLGIYRYGCSYHPWMTGVVDVEAANSTSTSTTPEFPATYLAVTLFAVIAAVMVAATRLRQSRPSPVST
jgi:plastocyanin